CLLGSTAALIAVCMRWNGGEYLFFAVPILAGALPSVLLTRLLTGGRRFRLISVLGPLMLGQLGWLIFLCIPGWGWWLFAYVFLPWAAGAAAGVLLMFVRCRWLRANSGIGADKGNSPSTTPKTVPGSKPSEKARGPSSLRIHVAVTCGAVVHVALAW